MSTAVQQAFPDRAAPDLPVAGGEPEVSRRWYDVRPSAEERAAREVPLRAALARLMLALPGYGSRRVTRAWPREGWEVHHQRGRRVLCQESLRCPLQRHCLVTIDATHRYATSPHLLAEAALAAPDQAWIAASTAVRLPSTLV